MVTLARYLGMTYTQSPGARLICFVAPADEIRVWGGVPHKTTDFLGGFQRPLSDRYKGIIDFFDQQSNQSPTAIVVAFRPQAIKITPLNNVGGATGLSQFVELEIPDPTDLETAPLKELARRVVQEVGERARSDVHPTPNIDDSDADAIDDAQAEQVADEEPVAIDVEDERSDWGVDVGKSALADFIRQIDSPAHLDVYLDAIAQKLFASEEAPSLPAAREAAEQSLRDVFASLLRPAMIVDGQHRVWGAAECEREIPFAVVGLIDADWKEQVFQFVIVNKQARAITGEFLASIVNSSLTNREIEELEDRLDAAGLSTYETRMLRLMNDDPDSPFAGLVSKGLDETGNKITFKAAMALVRRWSKKMNDRDNAYKTLFKPGLSGANSKEKQSDWEKRWKDFMFAFWHGIRNVYISEHLWEPKTQLMFRATLESLQDNFLEKKASAGGVVYTDPVQLRKDVEDFYQNVPGGFFHTEWKRKELLTKDGREVLRAALNAMRVPGTKLKQIVDKRELFTGREERR